MRKHFLIAGMLVAAALAFAVPSKADTVEFSVTGSLLPGGVTFFLPQTFAPTAGTGSGPFILANVSGSFFGNSYVWPNIELGLSAANNWAFGSSGVPNFAGTTGNYFALFGPGLFTVNGDGTITVNPLSGSVIFITNNANHDVITVTTTVIPSPVGTPEPATLALLGAGGLALTALRRRKAA